MMKLIQIPLLFSLTFTSSFGLLLPVHEVLAQGNDPAVQQDVVPILEDFENNGPGQVNIEAGWQTWYNYAKPLLRWAYYCAVGICVLWGLAGGIMIMISQDDTSKRTTGKDYIVNSIIGLLILIFAPLILTTLNSIFFT